MPRKARVKWGQVEGKVVVERHGLGKSRYLEQGFAAVWYQGGGIDRER